MTMAAAGARIPNPWEAVGRGTEVGRALFALYNGYGFARNRGNKYSDFNRVKIMERLASQGFPGPDVVPLDLSPKPKKPLVRVPHFRKKRMRIDDIPQVLLMRGRRKGSQILNKLKEDMYKKDGPPAPTKPLLDEKEKARLQEIFEWSGRVVEDEEYEVRSDVPMAPRKPPPAKGSVEEQEMLIEEIANEIEERKIFLDRMFELGRGPKYEPIIRLEIQERVRQMELLDKNITSMEKERFEGKTQWPAKSVDHSRNPSIMGEVKENSRGSYSSHLQPHVESRESKNVEFEEQLDALRRERMTEGRKNPCTRQSQDQAGEGEDVDEDEFGEFERGESSSEKSFRTQHSVPVTNSQPKYNHTSSPGDMLLENTTIKGKGPSGVTPQRKVPEQFEAFAESEEGKQVQGAVQSLSELQLDQAGTSLEGKVPACPAAGAVNDLNEFQNTDTASGKLSSRNWNSLQPSKNSSKCCSVLSGSLRRSLLSAKTHCSMQSSAISSTRSFAMA